MPDLFLSYSREDQAIARHFAEGLQHEGFSVWWDQALNAGEAFDRVTEKALDESSAVVVLWSKRSVESNWVRAEATQAHANQRLVPVMIEACRRPIMFELTHTADLAGWRGDATDARWRSFVQGLHRSIGKDSPASAGAVSASSTHAPRPAARRWRMWATASVVVVTLGIAALWKYHRENSAATRTNDASIAVLPFVNMSADPEQEYFSDGLSEELINQLAHIEGLQVTARTSAFAFKGKAQDLRAVGRTLGVAHILEGSVRKSGDRIRVTVQLINVADGYHAWSETYDRGLNDVFAIQDEIAAAVAGKLGPTLGVAPRSADYGGTRSLEAYDHLLRGDALFAKASPDGMGAAIEEYRRALAIDPAYARASAELAIAMGASGIAAGNPAAREERDAAIRRAIDGAPDAPLSQVAKMWLHSDLREWIEADAACAKAFAAARDPRAEWICGGFLSVTGRVRAALPYREAARRADPLSINVAGTVVRQYAFLDMGPELEREYARMNGLSGSRWQADVAMIIHLMHVGAPAERIAELSARVCPAALPDPCAAWSAAIRAPAGGSSLLRARLDAVRNIDPTAAIDVALAASYLGDRNLALDALEVFSHSSASASFQNLWYPLLAEVRKDPRFKHIVREIGFVDLWRKTGRWADYCHPLGDNDFECF